MRLLISSPIQLLALLDLMRSSIQQLPMLNLMYYESGFKIKIWPYDSEEYLVDPWPTTEVESLKLIHMYESYSHAM